MPSLPCPGPLSRRQFLKIGALSLGAGLGGVVPYQLASENGRPASDTAVIFIWLPGGPPHMETYDLKPDAPLGYRGEFRPVRTVVPGVGGGELRPMHGRGAVKGALICSISHTFADHGGGHKKFLTGRDPNEPVGFVNDHPMVGSMVAKVRQDRRAGVPNYIAGVDAGRQGIDVFSFG